jgi:hypothetical protein
VALSLHLAGLYSTVFVDVNKFIYAPNNNNNYYYYNCYSKSKRYSPNSMNCIKSNTVSLKYSEQTADKTPYTLFTAVFIFHEKCNKTRISLFICDAISAGLFRVSFLLYNFSLKIIIIIIHFFCHFLPLFLFLKTEF